MRHLFRRTGTREIAVAVLLAVCANVLMAQDFRKLGQPFFKKAAEKFTAPAPQRPQTPPAANPSQTAAPAIQIRPYFTTTADGWKLVANRYWRAGGYDPQKLPIILCHGFSYNALFYDLNPNVSLARYLAEQGFDVWVVDLRGCGLSSKWAVTSRGGADAILGRVFRRKDEAIPEHGYGSLDPKYAKWTMDDHVEYDIPALIELVKHNAKKDKVAWVGHSMGGNVMLARMSKYGTDPSVAKLVTVGSQVTMPDGQLLMQYLVELLKEREMQLTGKPVTPEQLQSSMNNVFFNQQNADPQVMQALATTANDVPSVGLIRQYMILSQSGWLQDARRDLNYAGNVSAITCPYLVMGGAADQIAPPTVQRHLWQTVRTENKQLVILGRQQGYSIDYGHNDSLVGRNSRKEVYPIISDWLMKH